MNILELARMRHIAQALVVGALALCGNAYATPAGATPEVLSPGTMLQFALGLGTVLALIVAAGWVMKKSAFGKSAPGMIKVIAGAAVGQRERVVVVDIDGVRMVLGVAPGRVTALHTLPRAKPPVEEARIAGAASEPKAWLHDDKDAAAEDAAAAAKLKAWLAKNKDSESTETLLPVKPDDGLPVLTERAVGDSSGAAARLQAWLEDQKELRGAH
jgi:flagellar protein FliO/FliZ